jgi:hypothetical protein
MTNYKKMQLKNQPKEKFINLEIPYREEECCGENGECNKCINGVRRLIWNGREWTNLYIKDN